MALCVVNVMALVLAVFSVASGSGRVDDGVYNSDCPLWTYRRNATSSCHCGTTAGGIIQCNLTSGVLSLRLCVCLTYDHSTNQSVIGYCPYSCVTDLLQPVHSVSMRNTSFTDICNAWNKEGPLCSKCKQGYVIPLYTYYDLKCVKCPRFQLKKLFRFLTISLVPPTILFILVTIFNPHILHPPWSVFMLVAQVISEPLLLKSALNIYRVHHKHTHNVVIKIIATILSPWNLDFFRAIYAPECIGPSITTLQSYAMDGLIGLYPLIILLLLYILVTLRDRGYKIALVIHFIFSRFRNSFNLRSSLVRTFATFYLLAFVKIGFSGMFILSATRVWSPDGSHVWVVYVDPSVMYFGLSHIGYAITTILLGFVVVMVPFLLLLFYPFQWFQGFLHYFKLRSVAVNTFVDVFQGCYKDGTNGTRDYRYFAALQLIIRLSPPMIFAFTLDYVLSIYLCSLFLGVYITAFILCRPYKNEKYNKTDVPALMVLLLASIQMNFSLLLTTYNYHLQWMAPCVYLVCVFVPLLYLVIWLFVYIKPTISHHIMCCKQHTETYEQMLPQAD